MKFSARMGLVPQKADPIARQAEVPPATASIVAAAVTPPPRRTPPGLDTAAADLRGACPFLDAPYRRQIL